MKPFIYGIYAASMFSGILALGFAIGALVALHFK